MFFLLSFVFVLNGFISEKYFFIVMIVKVKIDLRIVIERIVFFVNIL